VSNQRIPSFLHTYNPPCPRPLHQRSPSVSATRTSREHGLLIGELRYVLQLILRVPLPAAMFFPLMVGDLTPVRRLGLNCQFPASEHKLLATSITPHPLSPILSSPTAGCVGSPHSICWWASRQILNGCVTAVALSAAIAKKMTWLDSFDSQNHKEARD